MNIDLTRQTAVVTGAGRGIGLAVTRALTASAAHVIAGTRHCCAELDQLAAEGTVTTFEFDLAAPGQAELAAWAPTW
jgi:NAD(P)-dependent dehydrogenase (short-subunit alcohol dehydrogenase family)